MSRTAAAAHSPDRSRYLAPARAAGFKFGLLAALMACAAFWVLVALSVYWLI